MASVEEDMEESLISNRKQSRHTDLGRRITIPNYEYGTFVAAQLSDTTNVVASAPKRSQALGSSRVTCSETREAFYFYARRSIWHIPVCDKWILWAPAVYVFELI